MKKILIILCLVLWAFCGLSCQHSTLQDDYLAIDEMNELIQDTACSYIDDVLQCCQGHYDENEFIDRKQRLFYIWDSLENSMLLMDNQTQVIYPASRQGDYLSGNRYVALVFNEEDVLFLKASMLTLALGADLSCDITFFFACSLDANHHTLKGSIYYSELAAGDVIIRGNVKVVNYSKNLLIKYINYNE